MPGRPAAGAASLREQLLDAAIAVFVEHGIQAASLSQVARRAGATPALMHYHFRDKPGLIETVIEERVLAAVDALIAAVRSDEPRPAVQLARDFVAGVSSVVATRPWLPQLWVREIVAESGALHELLPRRVLPKMAKPLVGQLLAAAGRGELRPGIDPRLLPVSLIGLSMFAHAARPIWSRMPGAENITDEVLLRHTQALIEGGIGRPKEKS